MAATLEDCVHDKRIDDIVSGDEVCTLCGLVLGPVMLQQSQHHQQQQQQHKGSCCSDDKWRIFMEDICHNANLTPETGSRSYQLFARLKTNPLTRGARLLNLAAYSLYCTAATDGVGLTPAEVCDITGAEPKQLCRLQKIFHPEEEMTFTDAKCHLGRLCYALDLQQCDEMHLRKLADLIRLEGCRPTTVAAALIYLYAAKRKRSSAAAQLKTLSAESYVSIESIRRAARTIQRRYPDCII